MHVFLCILVQYKGTLIPCLDIYRVRVICLILIMEACSKCAIQPVKEYQIFSGWGSNPIANYYILLYTPRKVPWEVLAYGFP